MTPCAIHGMPGQLCRLRRGTWVRSASPALSYWRPRRRQSCGNPDGYKYLLEKELRYDLILNGMIDAVVQATGCDGKRFCLQGYSGGAHLVHRYLFLHPGRVLAASIGAPGEVTLLDSQVDWWGGVQNIEPLFGLRLDLSELRRVPLQLVVGDQDTDTEELDTPPASRYWDSAAQRALANRIDRLRALQRSLKEAGVSPEFELMPGVEHHAGPAPAMALAKRFFARRLRSGVGECP